MRKWLWHALISHIFSRLVILLHIRAVRQKCAFHKWENELLGQFECDVYHCIYESLLGSALYHVNFYWRIPSLGILFIGRIDQREFHKECNRSSIKKRKIEEACTSVCQHCFFTLFNLYNLSVHKFKILGKYKKWLFQ